MLLRLPSILASTPPCSLPTVTDRYFVFAYFSGGWDELLRAGSSESGPLQHRDRGQHLESTFAYGTIPNLNEEDYLVPTSVDGMTFGPYIGDLAAHAEKLAVVRGMAMEAVAHQVARRHADGYSTRWDDRTRPVRGHLARDHARRGGAYTQPDRGCSVVQPGTTCGHGAPHGKHGGSLQVSRRRSLDILDSQRDALETFFEQRERAAHSRLRDIYDNRSVARTLIEMGLNEHFNIHSDAPEMADLREVFGVDSGITGEGGKLALMTAQALTQGISGVSRLWPQTGSTLIKAQPGGPTTVPTSRKASTPSRPWPVTSRPHHLETFPGTIGSTTRPSCASVSPLGRRSSTATEGVTTSCTTACCCWAAAFAADRWSAPPRTLGCRRRPSIWAPARSRSLASASATTTSRGLSFTASVSRRTWVTSRALAVPALLEDA